MVKVRRLFMRIALMVFLSAALLGQSSLAGAAGSPSASNPQEDPVAIWLVTWTTSSRYVLDDESDPYYFRTDYSLTQSGSTLVRQYGDGSWDDTAFSWHVTADYEESYRLPSSCWAPECCPPPYPAYATISSNLTWSITDPDRYNGLDHVLNVTTNQLQDGTWQASVPFDTLLGLNNTYAFTRTSFGESESECGVTTYPPSANGTDQYHPEWSLCSLPFPASLDGDAEGNDYTYYDEFSGVPSGNCENTQSNVTNATLSTDLTVRRLLGTDLTVNHLEVTQALQDDANSIPLVQGRRTVVRAFIGLGTSLDPIPGVTGVLTGYSGTTLLGTVAPFNPDGQITAPINPDWMDINDTLNFEIPVAWTLQPSLTLTVKVNPNRTIHEANYDNNEDSRHPSTRACNPIIIGYVPVHYAPPGIASTDPGTNISVGQAFMQKIFPVSETGIVYTPIGAAIFDETINIEGGGFDDSELVSLVSLLQLSSPPRPDHIFGWLGSLTYVHNGLGALPGVGAYGNDTVSPDMWRRTFAHEIGHNFNLPHPPKLAPLTTDGDHWFDVYERVIKPVPDTVTGVGDNLLDFMVPARLESEAWISPTNYTKLLDHLCAVPGAAAPALASQPPASDNLIISGSVSNTTPVVGVLNPLLHLSTVATSTLPTGSQYCVNLEDGSGTLLSEYCFDLSFDDDWDTPTSAAPFSMAIPYSADIKRVELIQNSSGSVLSYQVASANPPSVTVTYPNASGTLSGSQTITWSGSDADHDPLTYAILYSHDNGATWMGVAADITGTSYAVDFSGLPGTTGASGLIKVLVSDGFYTAQDTSNNPFTVANKPPTAAILSPSTGASFTTGPQIVLEGSGVDLQDGSLPDSALSWTSSLDGALGSGQLLEVTLKPGVHTITLAVTDSKGLTATASIQVTVVQSTNNHYLFLPLLRR